MKSNTWTRNLFKLQSQHFDNLNKYLQIKSILSFVFLQLKIVIMSIILKIGKLRNHDLFCSLYHFLVIFSNLLLKINLQMYE